MLKHYVIAALRTLMRHRLHAAVSIFALGIGLATAILVLSYVRFEMVYDRWVPDHARVYRLETTLCVRGGPCREVGSAPGRLIAAARDQVAGVQAAAGLYTRKRTVAVGNKVYFQDFTVADTDVLQILQPTFLRGDPKTALNDASSLVLSKRTAEKLFGTIDVVGQVVTLGGDTDLRVSAVIADTPQQSHLDLQAIAALQSRAFYSRKSWVDSWGSLGGSLYLKLQPGVTAATVTQALNRYFIDAGPQAWLKANADAGLPPPYRFSLRPIADVHLWGPDQESRPAGNPTTLFGLLALSALALALGMVNTASLTLARISARSAERSIRRALGARPRDLFAQVMTESLLITLAGAAVGWFAAGISMPIFAALMQRPLSLAIHHDFGLLALFVGLPLLVASITGAAAAWQASRNRPLQGLLAPGRGTVTRQPRHGLLLLAQFAAAIGLITLTVVIGEQTQFARDSDPGFNAQRLIVIDDIDNAAVTERLDGFQQTLKLQPNVYDVARTGIAPAERRRSQSNVAFADGHDFDVDVIAVGHDYFRTLGIGPLAGRLFRDGAADRFDLTEDAHAPPRPVVLSRGSVDLLGLGSPVEAIGRTARTEGRQVIVIGVVADLRIRSVREGRAPTFFELEPSAAQHLLVRLGTGDTANSLASIDRLWARFFPTRPIQRDFAQARYRAFYAGEDRQFRLLGVITDLTLAIAFSGLYAMTALAAQRRRREMAVRKILGARGRDLMSMLLWQFIKPVVLANLLAWPIAWWAARKWLDGFAERIALDAAPFALAGTITLLIALLTVAGHTRAVAQTHPALALREE